jgi:hypothetical protein
VLALVFAIESRISNTSWGHMPFRGVMAAILLGVMAYSEYVCLRVLATGRSSAADVSRVGWGGSTAALLVLLFAVLGPMRDLEKGWARRGRRRRKEDEGDGEKDQGDKDGDDD